MFKIASLSPAYSAPISETRPARSQKSENLIEMTVLYCLNVCILKEEVQPCSFIGYIAPRASLPMTTSPGREKLIFFATDDEMIKLTSNQ